MHSALHAFKNYNPLFLPMTRVPLLDHWHNGAHLRGMHVCMQQRKLSKQMQLRQHAQKRHARFSSITLARDTAKEHAELRAPCCRESL
eukprot:1147670-Pelagomonas_calceolata.AAC.8